MKTSEIIQIFDVPINNMTMNDALHHIKRCIDNNRKEKIYFVNAFYLNTAWEDAEYRKILCQGDYIFGDGTGVRMASRMVRTPVIDNVNGTDMIFPLCKLCQENKYRLFLLGSEPGVASGMKEWMEEHYPGIKVVGHQHGYFDREADGASIVDAINTGQTNVLLVGFSAPLQECWIHEHAEILNCQVIMGVGGLFDVYVGDKPRPSEWLRRFGLEWLGRLLHEPSRLWHRYLVGNPKFLLRVLWWKYLGGKKCMAD